MVMGAGPGVKGKFQPIWAIIRYPPAPDRQRWLKLAKNGEKAYNKGKTSTPLTHPVSHPLTRFRIAFLGLLALAFVASQTLSVQATVSGTTYVTRAELASALLSARSTNLPDADNNGQYPDIPKGSWYETPMFAAAQYGIITPDAKGNLRPMGSVSRAEFLKMLSYTFGISKEYPYLYTDIAKDAWYAKYAGIAQKYHLFDLKDPYSLQPTLLMQEKEAATALDRFIASCVPQGSNSAKQEKLQGKQQAADEARNGLTIYSVISTKKTNAILDTNPPAGSVHVTPAPQPAPSTLLTLPEVRTLIIDKVNEERRKVGAKPLTYNIYLESSAQQYAIDMAEQGFFGHVSPGGQTLKDRVGATGYYDRSFSKDCDCIKGYTFGENIARGQKSAEEVMAAWMKSPSHKEAILNPDYTDIGIGVFGGLWVQHFGGVLLP